MTMLELKPSFSVRVDEARAELHFVTSGLFDEDSMSAFLQEVAHKVAPILSSGRKMRALGDLSDYVVQTKEMGDTMASTLRNGEKAGIERTAIIMTSAILKMQYQRVSAGRNVQIFDNRIDALRWLRAEGS